MVERQYVPHAVTGEPVPVRTPEEQEAEREERRRNPGVRVSGVKCWCGAEKTFKGRGMFWLWAGDGVIISCKRGHKSILRFVPETVS